MSGKESPTDPTAPARKTVALIAQSNMRIEDYIAEFRIGFNMLGDCILDLYDQFGDPQISYEGREGELGRMDRSWFRKRPKMHMRGQTAIMNVDQEHERASEWFMLFERVPEVRQNPVKFRQVLSNLLTSGRHPNRDIILGPKEEAEAALKEIFRQEAEAAVTQKLVQAGWQPPVQPAGPPPVPAQPPSLPPGAAV